MKYREVFVTPRDFLRSTRIDLDSNTSNPNYVFTPLFARVLSRVVEGLLSNGPRAISITGPYGSGKSTAILELLRLLESHDRDRFAKLQREFPELQRFDALPKVISITVIGIPGMIGPNILSAITRWAELECDTELIDRILEIDSRDSVAIVDLISVLVKKYQDRSCVLVIDEMGKHLEYASAHPDENDVYLLQLLAEYAARSKKPTMSFITILHQAFESYGHRLLRTQREEFAKVQGRFEDIAFQVPVEDALRIIGLAVKYLSSDAQNLEPARKLAEQIGERLYDAGAISQSTPRQEYLNLCRQCTPLHPVTALLLGPLFRNFAQNERSLFSMLGSSEPYGFQYFLDHTDLNEDSPVLYGPSELYEYVSNSIGPSISHSAFSKRWAIIETALERVPEENQMARDLVRTIGLVTAVPIHQLVASSATLELVAGTDVHEYIDLLSSRSIIIYRRFSDSFRLWNGSDIDVEGLIEGARRVIGVPSLVDSLSEMVPPRPITARRHSMKTGALRWFEMNYISPDQLDHIYTESKPSAGDGRVYVVVGTDSDVVPVKIANPSRWQLVLWTTFPQTIMEAVTELSCIRWIKENTPALLDDDIARREVTEREREFEQLIEDIVRGSIHRPEGEVTAFTHSSTALKVKGNQINSLVSDICDELYPKAPHIINEFVNRDALSSAATAARNSLLKSMIEHGDKEKLGIEGYPPQLPIYLSTLLMPGLHRYQNGAWTLFAPQEDSTWFEAWMHVEKLTNHTYRSVAELWESLSSPPYGMRKGLLPILTVAFICVHRNRVSILKDETFVPELTPAVVELLVRNPERFQVQLSRMVGMRQTFVHKLVTAVTLTDVDGTSDLLSLVRPLVSFAHRLPEYTRNTKSVSDNASNIRQLLLTATEPADLLFKRLPSVLGFKSIDDIDPSLIDEIVSNIVQYIQELGNSYSELLRDVQSILLSAFGLQDHVPELPFAILRRRALLIRDVIRDLDTKAIVWRMSQDDTPEKWIESVASVIMKKTPKNWYDGDLDDFRQEVFFVERQFVHYETIAALYQDDEEASSPIRIGLTTTDIDFETVVKVSDGERRQSQLIVEELLNHLDSRSINGNQLLLIAAELVHKYYSTAENREADLLVQSTPYIKPIWRKG